MALKVLSKLNVEITENSIDMLQPEDLLNYLYWTQDGGDVTVKQFTELNKSDKEDFLKYLCECSLYEEIYMNDKRYILVHAGINNFDEERSIDTYRLEDLIFARTDL